MQLAIGSVVNCCGAIGVVFAVQYGPDGNTVTKCSFVAIKQTVGGPHERMQHKRCLNYHDVPAANVTVIADSVEELIEAERKVVSA